MNRMMDHAPMTVPMDLLGLQKRRQDPLRQTRPNESVLTLIDDSPTHKETHTMRYISGNEVVLRLKDDGLAMPDQSTNFAEVEALKLEIARRIDATYGIQDIAATLADIVRRLMATGVPTPPRSGKDYLMAIADARVKQFQDEDRAKRWGQEVAAANAVPLAKRIKPGVGRICIG